MGAKGLLFVAKKGIIKIHKFPQAYNGPPHSAGRRSHAMNTEQTELERLTGCLGQPAFYEEDGKVLFCNRLAEQARVRVGRDVAEMLPAGTALPEGGAAAHATLNLPGAQTAVTIVPWSKGRLYLLSPSDHAQLQPQALVAIAQSIRTPLSNLFGVAASLFPRLEAMEDDEIQQQTASMNRAFYQLLRLTCNLTDMRGVMLEEMRLLREKEELTGYFRRLFDRAAPLLKASGRRLVYTCGARPFCGWIGRQRLERAVWDILSNAAKFTPKDGVITAELEYTHSAAILRVHDNGEGLTPEQLAHAFSAHDREYAPGDPRWGAGFGLPLAEHIARLHGGALLLESGTGGTTVTLSISLHVPATKELQFRSPTAAIDYSGGYPHELVELSNVLPVAEFDSSRIN